GQTCGHVAARHLIDGYAVQRLEICAGEISRGVAKRLGAKLGALVGKVLLDKTAYRVLIGDALRGLVALRIFAELDAGKDFPRGSSGLLGPGHGAQRHASLACADAVTHYPGAQLVAAGTAQPVAEALELAVPMDHVVLAGWQGERRNEPVG